MQVETGLTRLEQEYEHLLAESSTEISEMEGSIRNKQAAIAKLEVTQAWPYLWG